MQMVLHTMRLDVTPRQGTDRNEKRPRTKH